MRGWAAAWLNAEQPLKVAVKFVTFDTSHHLRCSCVRTCLDGWMDAWYYPPNGNMELSLNRQFWLRHVSGRIVDNAEGGKRKFVKDVDFQRWLCARMSELSFD